eukprot:g8373.t1
MNFTDDMLACIFLATTGTSLLPQKHAEDAEVISRELVKEVQEWTPSDKEQKEEKYEDSSRAELSSEVVFDQPMVSTGAKGALVENEYDTDTFEAELISEILGVDVKNNTNDFTKAAETAKRVINSVTSDTDDDIVAIQMRVARDLELLNKLHARRNKKKASLDEGLEKEEGEGNGEDHFLWVIIQEESATAIQAIARGMLARKRVNGMVMKKRFLKDQQITDTIWNESKTFCAMFSESNVAIFNEKFEEEFNLADRQMAGMRIGQKIWKSNDSLAFERNGEKGMFLLQKQDGRWKRG